MKSFDSLNEGETAEVWISLDASSGNTIVYLESSSSSLLLNQSQKITLTFDSHNYSIPQKVKVYAPEEVNLIDEDVILSTSCVVCNSLSIPIKVKDNDSQRIISYNYPESLNEGQSKSFQVKLNVKPSSNINVSFASSDNSALTVSPSSISFTPDNYNSFQNITLSAIEDIDSTSESTNISVSASGLSGVTFPVTTYDNDIQILFSLPSININEGTSQTVQIQLTTDPSTSKTVQIASSDTNSITVSPAAITFDSSNWNVPVTITINAIQDNNVTNETISVSAQAIGLTSSNLSVVTVDDDTLNFTITGSTQVMEAQTTTITIGVTMPLSAPMTVNLSSSLGSVALSPSVFLLSPASPTRTITVIANIDANTNAETTILTTTATGVPSLTYNMLVFDKDTGIQISGLPTILTSGQLTNFNIKLSGDPGTVVIVNLSSIYPGSTIVPSSFNFNNTNWNTNQIGGITASFNASAGSAVSILGTGSNLISGSGTTSFGEMVVTFAGSLPVPTSGFVDAIGVISKFNRPVGIAVDTNGDLFIADNYNHAIRKITNVGVVTTFAGSITGASGFVDGTGTAARLSYPTGITIDSSGNFFVTDSGNAAVRKITSAGLVTTVSTGILANAQGIAIDGTSDLYVADYSNHAIRKVTSGGVITTFAGSTAGVSGFVDGAAHLLGFNNRMI